MITKNRLFLLLTLITTGITLIGMEEQQSTIDHLLPIEKTIESNSTEENNEHSVQETIANEDTPQNEHPVQETITNLTNTADTGPTTTPTEGYAPLTNNEPFVDNTAPTIVPIVKTSSGIFACSALGREATEEEEKVVYKALAESTKKYKTEIKNELLPNSTEKRTPLISQTVDTVQDNQTVSPALNMEEVKRVVDEEFSKLSKKTKNAINKAWDQLEESEEAGVNYTNKVLSFVPSSLQKQILETSGEEQWKAVEEGLLLLDENERRNILNNWPQFVQKLNEILLLFGKPSQKQQEQLPIIEERMRSALERSLQKSTQNVLAKNNPEKPIDTVSVIKSSFFEKMCYIVFLKGLFKGYENRSFIGSVSQADALRFTLALTGLTTVSYGCYRLYQKRKSFKKWILQNPLVQHVTQGATA